MDFIYLFKSIDLLVNWQSHPFLMPLHKNMEVLDSSTRFWHQSLASGKPLGKSSANRLISEMKRVYLYCPPQRTAVKINEMLHIVGGARTISREKKPHWFLKFKIKIITSSEKAMSFKQ